MSIFNLKTAALAIVAGVGLSGCAYGPYGGLGVGVGYGNGYGYTILITAAATTTAATATPTALATATALVTATAIHTAPAIAIRTATDRLLRLEQRLLLPGHRLLRVRPRSASASLDRRAASLLGAAARRRDLVRRRCRGSSRTGPTSRTRTRTRPRRSATVRQRSFDRQRIIRERPVASSRQVRTEQQVQRRSGRSGAQPAPRLGRNVAAHAVRTAARTRTKQVAGAAFAVPAHLPSKAPNPRPGAAGSARST